MENMAYEFKNSVSRLSFMERGDAYDIKAFEFSEMSEIRYLHQQRVLNLPDITFFYLYSTLEFVQSLDSLSANQTQCVFSERLIDKLLATKDFKHARYKVAILEEGATKFQINPDGYNSLNPYEKPEFFRRKSIREDMFLFQTLEFIDAFDWEKSIYQQSESDKKRNHPGYVRKYVLKEPPKGFPPVFRLTNDPVPLFISHEARESLKKAKIRGPAYSLLNNLWNSEVDFIISY